MNLYGFAGGDPVNFSDPMGLCPPEKTCRRYTLGHLSEVSVSEGDEVSANQQVGKSGNTGHSTGAHLHYEVGDVDKDGNYTPDTGAAPSTDGCPMASCDDIASTPAGNRCLSDGSPCKPHNGTDIAVPEGTVVNAPAAGQVIHAGWEDPKNHKKGFGPARDN